MLHKTHGFDVENTGPGQGDLILVHHFFSNSVPRLLYFLLNSKSGRATIAGMYGKDKKVNEEDIALLIKARSPVSSDKFKTKKEVLKDLEHPRWRSGFPKPWQFFMFLALWRFS
jgi:hypothetical protein